MKNKFYLLIQLSLITFTISSCDTTDTNNGQFTNGVFVINEGAFGTSNSEVSFISNDNNVYNNLYAGNNSSAILGDVFQSMYISNGNAYLVINNSAKVEVVGIDDLQNNGTINGVVMPRYMVSYNGKGYISDWISFSGNGKIWVADLSTNSIIDSVNVGLQPEQMMVVGSNILVANSADTTLHLINTTNHTTTHIGDIDYPKYITKTSDGNIWILYTGKPSWAVGGPTDGGLLVLNSTATGIVKNVSIGSTSTYNPAHLCTDGNYLYYEYQGAVYKMDKSATIAPSISSNFIFGQPAATFYGMQYDPSNNILLVADAKNFITSGVVKRYDASSGSLIDTLIVGVAPNGFVFN